jgi:RNA polymerase sigma-70 factor (ECF subfamily)
VNTHALQRAEIRWDWDRAQRVCLAEARRWLGHTDTAEDAAQEAALRAWQRRHTCRHPAAPEPWLRQIARNEALRILGRGSPDALEDQLEPAVDGDPLDVRALDLRRAMAVLSDDDRRLLGLRYWADLTQQQVATAVKLPTGTVKVRLHRLRSHLRTQLSEETA